MKNILIIFVFFHSNLLFSQLSFKELSGLIKLNDSMYIPYNLYLNKINDTIISGYSVTDKDGAHETKSLIKGTYNSENKILKFNEYDIVYTKSSFDSFDFCFVYFENKIKSFKNLNLLQGDFFGKFQNGNKCLNGTLLLANKVKIEAKVEKVQKKLDKLNYKKFVEKKPVKIDSIKLKNINANENLNIFIKSKFVTISVFDSGKIDNDRVDLFVNNKLLLENYTIKKEKKSIPLSIKNKDTNVKVVALNEGTSAPNTVKIIIEGDGIYAETRTTLKTGESAKLTLTKK